MASPTRSTHASSDLTNGLHKHSKSWYITPFYMTDTLNKTTIFNQNKQFMIGWINHIICLCKCGRWLATIHNCIRLLLVTELIIYSLKFCILMYHSYCGWNYFNDIIKQTLLQRNIAWFLPSQCEEACYKITVRPVVDQLWNILVLVVTIYEYKFRWISAALKICDQWSRLSQGCWTHWLGWTSLECRCEI